MTMSFRAEMQGPKSKSGHGHVSTQWAQLEDSRSDTRYFKVAEVQLDTRTAYL